MLAAMAARIWVADVAGGSSGGVAGGVGHRMGACGEGAASEEARIVDDLCPGGVGRV